MAEAKKPKMYTSEAERELDKVQEQFEKYETEVRSMTFDQLNLRPKLENEPPKVSQVDLAKYPGIYLKPEKAIGCQQKFNEDYRKEYEFMKEYVNFMAENKECIGDNIEIWTRPYGGLSAEFWRVPVNKPVWGPRYLAEQIKRKYYHRLVMQETAVNGSDQNGTYYGKMTVDTTIPRLDCHPISSKKSVFV